MSPQEPKLHATYVWILSDQEFRYINLLQSISVWKMFESDHSTLRSNRRTGHAKLRK